MSPTPLANIFERNHREEDPALKLSRSAAHRRILKWQPLSKRPPVVVVERRATGPERVRVTLPEKTKYRPFEAALAPMCWEHQRRAANEQQPRTPDKWDW